MIPVSLTAVVLFTVIVHIFYSAAHAGKCTISETIVILPGEKVKSPETCAEIHCGNENGDATITG